MTGAIALIVQPQEDTGINNLVLCLVDQQIRFSRRQV